MKSIFGVFLIILMTSIHVMAYDQLTLNGFSIDANGAITFTGGTNTGAFTNTGAVTLTGNVTTNGVRVKVASSTIYQSTATAITITDEYMMVSATMPVHVATAAGRVISPTARPQISTNTATYALGTEVTIVVTSGTVVFTDHGTTHGTGMNLGSTTRSLSIGDMLTIVLQSLDSKIRWLEKSFTDN